MGKHKKSKHNIVALANMIAECERNIRANRDVGQNQQKIEEIMSSLTFDEMIQLDDYIERNNIL